MNKLLGIKYFCAIIILFSVFQTHAAFMLNASAFYYTDSDDVTGVDFSYTRMNNSFFLGASMGKKQQLFFGLSYMMIQRDNTVGGVSSDISLSELGPTFIYYFDQDRKWYISASWLPFSKGTRTIAGAVEDVDGSGLHGGLGYQIKIRRFFYIGASVNYHSSSLTEAISASNVKSDISNTYTSIMPMLDFSFRFK